MSEDDARTVVDAIRSIHQAGKVRVLASVSENRLHPLPDVPSFGELGLPYEGAVMERIVMAPAGTPDDRVRVLEAAFRMLYQDADFRDLMEKMEENLDYMGAAEYDALRPARSDAYRALVREILK